MKAKELLQGFIAGMAATGTVVAGIDPAWEGTTRILGRPTCLVFSDRYYYVDGFFERKGYRWIEHHEEARFVFSEFSRDRRYILLKNETARPDNLHWRSLTVRLPVCGGVAQISSQNPQNWYDLWDVVTSPSPGRSPYYEQLRRRQD